MSVKTTGAPGTGSKRRLLGSWSDVALGEAQAWTERVISLIRTQTPSAELDVRRCGLPASQLDQGAFQGALKEASELLGKHLFDAATPPLRTTLDRLGLQSDTPPTLAELNHALYELGPSRLLKDPIEILLVPTSPSQEFEVGCLACGVIPICPAGLDLTGGHLHDGDFRRSILGLIPPLLTNEVYRDFVINLARALLRTRPGRHRELFEKLWLATVEHGTVHHSGTIYSAYGRRLLTNPALKQHCFGRTDATQLALTKHNLERIRLGEIAADNGTTTIFFINSVGDLMTTLVEAFS